MAAISTFRLDIRTCPIMPPILSWLHTLQRRQVIAIIVITATAEMGRVELISICWRSGPRFGPSCPQSPALSAAPCCWRRPPCFVTQLSLGLGLCGSDPVLWPLSLKGHLPGAKEALPNSLDRRVQLERVCVRVDAGPKVRARDFWDSGMPDAEGQDPSGMF